MDLSTISLTTASAVAALQPYLPFITTMAAEKLGEKVPKANGERRVANGEEDVAAETNYGLNKCQLCGQMVMGFDREEHVRDVHGGQEVGFVKL